MVVLLECALVARVAVSFTPCLSVAPFQNGVRENPIRFEEIFLNACSASPAE